MRAEQPQVIHPLEAATVADAIFRATWRTTLEQPGFAVLQFSRPITSQELRRAMLDLVGAMPVRFVPERLGRFDQQVSSRFHRDGAPAASLLVLGYEPTTVLGHLFVADAHRAAHAAGLGIAVYLANWNPMTLAGEQQLWPFSTQLAVPRGEAYLVVINNSLLPFESGNPLGLLHKAEIVAPDLNTKRVINSVGCMLAADISATPKEPETIRFWLERDDLD